MLTNFQNIPPKCVEVFTLDHAVIFKREGFFIQRHNDTRDLAAEFLSTVYSDGEVDPELQDISGEQLKRGADKTKGVTLNPHSPTWILRTATIGIP